MNHPIKTTRTCSELGVCQLGGCGKQCTRDRLADATRAALRAQALAAPAYQVDGPYLAAPTHASTWATRLLTAVAMAMAGGLVAGLVFGLITRGVTA